MRQLIILVMLAALLLLAAGGVEAQVFCEPTCPPTVWLPLVFGEVQP